MQTSLLISGGVPFSLKSERGLKRGRGDQMGGLVIDKETKSRVDLLTEMPSLTIFLKSGIIFAVFC